MAEATDELLPVKCVRRLLHPPHSAHLLVHVEETVLRHLHLQARSLCLIPLERIFMKLDCEWLGV